MKLLSATVRNYRIHRELHVEFDESRTLIGGANEAGKSTLIEAVHRGLFLKSTVTGEIQRSMMPGAGSGHPEVEIRFSAQDREFQLFKRFSGPNGTTRLLEAGGKTWHGDEAESCLAGILGVEELGGGKGILNKLPQQWAHLWVWQGMSGENPSEHVASQQADLLRQLQQAGGAVALQSRLDEKVSSRFSEARNQIFVRSGKARSGSDLDQAEQDAAAAESARDAAAEILDKHRRNIQEFENAASTIISTDKDLEELRREKGAVDEKIRQSEELQRNEKEQAAMFQEVENRLSELEGLENQINKLRISIKSIQEILDPRRQEEGLHQSSLDGNSDKIKETVRIHTEALGKVREARIRKELASSLVKRIEKNEDHKSLKKRLDQVEALEKEILKLDEEIARLAPVNQDNLKGLKKQETEIGKAAAALKAMAAEIEVIEASLEIRVGKNILRAGDRETIMEPTELKAGDSVLLKIHPGGGKSLGEAREKLQALRRDLTGSLDEFGLESVEAAASVLAQREKRLAKRGQLDAVLKAQTEDDLSAKYREVKEAIASAEAEVERFSCQVEFLKLPSSLAEAVEWRKREGDALQALESDEKRLKDSLDFMHEEQDKLLGKLENLRKSLEEESYNLERCKAQLDLLLETHGEDQIRAEKIGAANRDKREKEACLSETRKKLAGLQPDILENDRERLERALSVAEQRRQEAKSSLDRSQALLESDGEVDLHASLAWVEARLQSAGDHLEIVRRRSMAVALIDDLFHQEQQALADRFSQPLAEKITSYLQCLFGPEAKAAVTFEEHTFKQVGLIRSNREGSMPFESLSGGAREQVAAAVRLAIAELLAQEHGGSLPIVFDDAFAYSDPERVTILQRMLDLGASRGLQVIVITCNPSDYASLGARQTILTGNSQQIT